MENKIQFIAKHNDWFVVKKMNIDDKTEAIEIARLLSSIDETVLNKLPEYLPLDMKKLDEIADEIYQKKKGGLKRRILLMH